MEYLESSITTKKAIFRLSSTWSWHAYTIVRDARSSCGGPLTWKAQIHDGGHGVNFDRNSPSSCFVVQYYSLISMISLRFATFTTNVNCICCEKDKDKTVLLTKISGVKVATCLLPKISGVEVTPSVNSVESSEQFWRICEP